MRTIDFTISIFSLLFYFLANRFYYIYAMKSHDYCENCHLYVKLSFISKFIGRIFILFFSYAVISLSLTVTKDNLIAYLIAILTLILIYLTAVKANENLLNEAHEKINKK